MFIQSFKVMVLIIILVKTGVERVLSANNPLNYYSHSLLGRGLSITATAY